MFDQQPQALPCNPQRHIYAVDGVDELFDCFGKATLIAALRVHETRRSVAIYRNGELYDLKRF